MRTTAAGFSSLVLALATSTFPLLGITASAAPKPSASPSAPSESFCNARIAYGAPLDNSKGSTAARTWAIALATLDNTFVNGSGSLALYAGKEHYEVPFADAALVAHAQDVLVLATPIVIRFPRPVNIDGGYVSNIGGADAGPCPPNAIWTSQAQQAPQAGFTKRALLATAQDAAAPSEWTGACADPIVGVKVANGVQPTVPASVGSTANGTVYVAVAVGSDGAIAQSVVVGPSGTPDLDAATLAASQSSTYLPAQFDCRPIASLKILRTDYINSKPVSAR